MNTQARLGRVLFSPFMLWIAALIVCSYFIFSFDKKALVVEVDKQESIWDSVQRYGRALKLTHVKKGIDLAGGTYLVLGVELEKAIENKLALENKNFDTLFQTKGLRSLPTKKQVLGDRIELEFANDEAARACANLLKDVRKGLLRVKQSEAAVEVMLAPEVELEIRTGAIEQAVNVLSNRLGGYGVEGIVVQEHGDRQVVVQLPGIDDPEHVKSVITKTAHLEFKIVEKVAATKDSLLDDFDHDLPSDKMIIPGRVEEGEQETRWYLVSAFPDLTGDRMVSARVEYDEFNRPVVSFKLDSAGGREFAELTGNNIGRNLGIIIDDVVYMAPNIKQELSGGSGQISGNFTRNEAFDLALVLKSGALHAPLKIEQENRVGASLGQDSINSGIMSCLIALLLVFIFSILYYKIPGLLAVIALVCNIFLTLVCLSYLKATLTLPGVAGIVLTIGMAIDASILIYERIKEELAAGTGLRTAINHGFGGAMAVIMDSNITTFLTGLVLYQFGGPAIKGFAVTLMAGIVATLLSGIYFLKAMFVFLLDMFGIKEMKF
ncbi:MAG: protein translocase subunit SecD [Epsilonproteobacteria bacterium]|nr:protein translocase subunit SecD [Campylobacterota bacterium]